jgi:hypothetical protein
MPAPEATARLHIDRALTESGWIVLDIADANLGVSRGVAIREFPLTTGYGFADYVLFVDEPPVKTDDGFRSDPGDRSGLASRGRVALRGRVASRGRGK